MNQSVKQRHVLIAEDDLNSSLYLSILLEDDYHVTAVYNGKEAVNQIKSNNKIDLVLMDMNMPIMSGVEATQLIKSVNNKIPVIVQTAHTFGVDVEAAMKAGCDDFITKPIDPGILKSKLDKYLD